MKIQKNAAVALFIALGLKNADKWNDARLAAKLGKIKEMVDEDVKLEGTEQENLTAVMAAAAAGEEFEIEGGEPVEGGSDGPVEQNDKATAAPKQTDEEKAAAKATKEAEKTAAKAAKDEEKAKAKEAKAAERAEKKAAAKAAKKAEREAKKAESEADRVKGRKRLRACGLVLRTHGMVDGSFVLKVTPELVAEVDAIVGKPNPTQTEHSLAQAWSAIAGYFEDGK